MKLFRTFLLLIFFLFSHNNISYSNEKIYTLDINFILKNSNIGKKTLENINKINLKNIEIIKSNENELKKIDNEIKKKKNILSQSEIDNEVNLLKIKLKKFNDDKNKMAKDFNNFRKKELENVFNQINPIIQEYMEKNSIEILIDSKYVFMSKSSADLTKILIDKINNILN